MSDMSNMKRPGQRSYHTKRAAAGQARALGAAHELELSAIEEQFLAEWHAGLRPQLSAYLRRYPGFGAELAAFVALTFTPEAEEGALCLAYDDEGRRQTQIELSSGTRRALDTLFGSQGGEAPIERARVAERHAGYDTASTRLDTPGDEGQQKQ